MRTPLNAVIGLSELALGYDSVTGQARENIEKVYHAGMNLLSIVNDLLDMSKIEAGKFELLPAEYDVPSLINDTVTLNIPRIGSKPITFHLDIDGTLPGKLFGDDLRIRQVFNNLLSNAFKYTQEGDVYWSLSCRREGDFVWLEGTVRDTGSGIRREDLNKLFSTYGQVDTKSNRKIEGTGLGLTITKRMVEFMDGDISVDSEYGKGSVFTVRIKQGFVSDSVIGDEVARNLKDFHYTDSKRSRNEKLVRVKMPYASVLVVDDVATNLDVAGGLLKPYGMHVDFAGSGPEAIALVEKAEVKYNAIFMDHMMPGMDGIEAARRIRGIETEYAKNVPILALTANAITGNEEMFLKNGFQAFLSKPIDIMALDAAIRRFVRNRDLETQLGLSGQETENAVPSKDTSPSLFEGKAIEGMDFIKGTALYGGDEETYLHILRSYTKNTPELINGLRGLTENNLRDYAITAHSIKGSSLSIGAGDAGKKAEALEYAAKSGDFAFVTANNGDFINRVEKLLADLSVLLEGMGGGQKLKKEAPDKTVLEELLKAAQTFDIDGVDKTMEELARYEYESGGDLVEWLEEKVKASAFKQIAERLSQ
ncbi:hypothetical protein AGMMS49928_02790 [Spirochaetia bacterium]|nr:hypothetical protein AGMMS49928_02790 [Spirochaetia bacterium]